ncbi:hypothetical protein Glove_17g37 [Diversispora epigaea]|uniref:Uncharacterized protein n=1 Tax=Diversispora epigaea TaxID=1348612 RepID=A0A397JXQ7_9GLOM|nr:hypothetical protein Glove_17g37 [Diversispora epigaea]
MKSLQELPSLHESDLVSILKNEDLQMNELEILGTAQNSTVPESLEEWSDENFITLKVTLQKCLPLIHYFHISNSDVMYKIKSYKKILNKKIWNDLKKLLILPDQSVESIIFLSKLVVKQELPTRIIELFSTIINGEHTAMILSQMNFDK